MHCATLIRGGHPRVRCSRRPPGPTHRITVSVLLPKSGLVSLLSVAGTAVVLTLTSSLDTLHAAAITDRKPASSVLFGCDGVHSSRPAVNMNE